MGVLFLKCDTTVRKTCKTDALIKEWLKDKFLLFVYNKKMLQSEKYAEERLKKTSFMDWVPIDINNQMITPYNVQISELNSKDTIWPSGYKIEEYYNL